MAPCRTTSAAALGARTGISRYQASEAQKVLSGFGELLSGGAVATFRHLPHVGIGGCPTFASGDQCAPAATGFDFSWTSEAYRATPRDGELVWLSGGNSCVRDPVHVSDVGLLGTRLCVLRALAAAAPTRPAESAPKQLAVQRLSSTRRPQPLTRTHRQRDGAYSCSCVPAVAFQQLRTAIEHLHTAYPESGLKLNKARGL